MRTPPAYTRLLASASRALRRKGVQTSLILGLVVLLIWYLYQPLLQPTPVPPRAGHQDSAIFAPGHVASRTLLVSAYFPLSKSKHSGREYQRWLTNFLANIRSDVFMFTTPAMVHTLQVVRGSLPLQLNTTFSHPSDAPVFDGLRESFRAQWKIDPEQSIHNPELYMVWAAKPYFVREAVRTLRAQNHSYDYVFWIDAGTLRETHSYSDWPDTSRLDELWQEGASWTGTPKEDLLFLPIEHEIPARFATWTEKDGPIRSSSSEGSFFGGAPVAIEWYLDAFMTYTRHYMELGYFAGKDQEVINALLLLYPERFITLFARDPRAPSSPGQSYYGWLGYCGDPWYYFLFQLANKQERLEMNTIWQQQWRIDYWHGQRLPCRGTRILPITNIHLYSLGAAWQKPNIAVQLQHL